MSEKRTYTAEDFENEAEEMAQDYPPVVMESLRLAANVMRPGLIEKTLDNLYDGLGDDDARGRDAVAIRKALLGEAEDAHGRT